MNIKRILFSIITLLLSTALYFYLDNWQKHKKTLKENGNPTLVKLGSDGPVSVSGFYNINAKEFSYALAGSKSYNGFTLGNYYVGYYDIEDPTFMVIDFSQSIIPQSLDSLYQEIEGISFLDKECYIKLTKEITDYNDFYKFLIERLYSRKNLECDNFKLEMRDKVVIQINRWANLTFFETYPSVRNRNIFKVNIDDINKKDFHDFMSNGDKNKKIIICSFNGEININLISHQLDEVNNLNDSYEDKAKVIFIRNN
ncbi:hypothetical protein [Flammeovirga agarivorans]|uniref:Uncharacterized protein n=1 Tax=Flammeovirga agarivorans TaxID=2726742 RepID=A0A7X8SP88_9BACT|nr:hypothetical protein [Flammeovirga agarivorans]NLR93757.1 hypothetical protein [Flammeovirga agarivorans]